MVKIEGEMGVFLGHSYELGNFDPNILIGVILIKSVYGGVLLFPAEYCMYIWIRYF